MYYIQIAMYYMYYKIFTVTPLHNSWAGHPSDFRQMVSGLFLGCPLFRYRSLFSEVPVPLAQ